MGIDAAMDMAAPAFADKKLPLGSSNTYSIKLSLSSWNVYSVTLHSVAQEL
jgi:hypothetical protein